MIGIDEVGRGAWAGPLVVVAVELADSQTIEGLTDSKLLTKIQRKKLDKEIRQQAKAIHISWTKASQIDDLGLSVAMDQAVRRLFSSFSNDYSSIIIDGNVNYLSDQPKTRAVIKAEQRHQAVAAASVVAKVARDSYMAKISLRYPVYGFSTHVGYGTKQHHNSLVQHGICQIHRKSFKPVKLIHESHSKGEKS